MKNKHVIALSCLGLAVVISAGTVFYSVFSMVQGTTSAATCTVDTKLMILRPKYLVMKPDLADKSIYHTIILVLVQSYLILINTLSIELIPI